ncbi:hypothetical protein QQZ08_001143 [Neonectria magnoliae]|uniref:N-acetyltransferase domain-containing protein n=1 Tax=Neonectria magnoliae TaxID=2732573 RepID=A0ABR1IH59_9HYPO
MTVLTLPKSLPSPKEFDLLVSKYKAFRLLSLQLSPESFGSTYARELGFSKDTWISRVSNSLATSIVEVSTSISATSHPDAVPDHVQLLLKEEWLASLTILGPLDREAAAKAFASDSHPEPEAVLHGDAKWHFLLNAMYVLPSARGRRLGGALVAYAKTVASELVSEQKARILLVTDWENEGARRTYKKSGFEVVARYWFDDYREGRTERTEAVVMKLDLN